ncbi:MAG: WecB/TagA/CpsF family glycosyltransferase [Methylophilaceae bacterium]
MQQEASLQKQRHRIFGVDIDLISMSETVITIFQWFASNETNCKFVITPNVDHIVKVQDDPAFLHAYQKASLVVTDGKPVLWAAKILGINMPGTVPGSDLVPAIFDYAQANNKPIKVFLLGAMPGVADRAKVLISQQWSVIDVVGTLSPDFNFDKNERDSLDVCQAVNNSQADLLVLGLGSPKQELWITAHASQISAKAALCVGATIDFLAGEKSRAPVWMRNFGLEWLYRLILEPRRLAKRYFIDAVIFPKIIFREWLLRLKPASRYSR